MVRKPYGSGVQQKNEEATTPFKIPSKDYKIPPEQVKLS